MVISITPLLQLSTGLHESRLGGEHVMRPLVHRHCSQSSLVHISSWSLTTSVVLQDSITPYKVVTRINQSDHSIPVGHTGQQPSTKVIGSSSPQKRVGHSMRFSGSHVTMPLVHLHSWQSSVLQTDWWSLTTPSLSLHDAVQYIMFYLMSIMPTNISCYTIGGGKGGATGLQPHLILRVLHRVLFLP